MSKKEKGQNKTDILLNSFEDLNDEINFDDLDEINYFVKICELKPDRDNEKLIIVNGNKDSINRTGLVYAFVIKNKLVKIGHTTTSFKDRVQSYNCGKKKYRENGTCSVTNYFILQSLLNINENVEIYAFFPDQPVYYVFDRKFQDGVSPSKTAEGLILKNLKDKNKLPIGCIQN